MNIPKSSTETLINALQILSVAVNSEDGVANAALAEAAQRLHEQQERIKLLESRLATRWKSMKADHHCGKCGRVFLHALAGECKTCNGEGRDRYLDKCKDCNGKGWIK
jgi:hypothetical protein